MLCTLGFNGAWLFQDIGDSVVFLSLVKQRLNGQFIRIWNGRLDESSTAIFYKHISYFGFKPYLNILNISKFRYSMTKLRYLHTDYVLNQVDSQNQTPPH